MSGEMKEPDDSQEANDEQAESRERNHISEGSANLLNEAQREAATPDRSSVRGGTDLENDKPRNPIPAGNGASNPVGDSNDSSDPFSPDYRSSPLEGVIDAVALQSYDESLAAGPERYRHDEQDPSPLIDLIRVPETAGSSQRSRVTTRPARSFNKRLRYSSDRNLNNLEGVGPMPVRGAYAFRFAVCGVSRVSWAGRAHHRGIRG